MQAGDVVKSATDVLMILEAMKTEIPIHAGERNVGRAFKQLGKSIAEGAIVRPGDTLLKLV
jgi:urea carboxylase